RTSPATRTLSPDCVKVIVPVVLLPFVGWSSATALGPAGCRLRHAPRSSSAASAAERFMRLFLPHGGLVLLPVRHRLVLGLSEIGGVLGLTRGGLVGFSLLLLVRLRRRRRQLGVRRGERAEHQSGG